MCTRNDDLQGVLDSTPKDRREGQKSELDADLLTTFVLSWLLCADLVFIQNGMLQPWLDARGLGDNTQVNKQQAAFVPHLNAQVLLLCTLLMDCGEACTADKRSQLDLLLNAACCTFVTISTQNMLPGCLYLKNQ